MCADELSSLGSPPNWQTLDPYQNTITREAFLEELTQVYSIGESYKLTMDVQLDHVRIKTAPGTWMALLFRQSNQPQPTIKRYWRSRAEILAAAQKSPNKPLSGLRIALDPGHLGGRWAKMEERWYTLPVGGKPVTEGDMTLLVSQMLAKQLKALGAKVMHARSSTAPITSKRPKDFEYLARADLLRMGIQNPVLTYPDGAPPKERSRTLQWHSEKYFYRLSEIRARADLVNKRLKPDLALCLHFNAEHWGDPSEPEFVPRNHLHFLINGAYNISELGNHDERYQMLMRLLQRMHGEERPLSEMMAQHMARHTQLPAYQYTTNNVKRPSKNPYVYARNLLANRLFECPVIYFEPYVMNSEEVYARVQAGHYEGKRLVHGQERPSLYHEYVEGVVQGLLAYYQPKP
jgi:hypothetical protein